MSLRLLVAKLLTIDFSKETVRVKVEQEKNAEMKKIIAEEGGYHDGRKYYKKKTKGIWFNNDFITASDIKPHSNNDRLHPVTSGYNFRVTMTDYNVPVTPTLTIKSKLFEHEIC